MHAILLLQPYAPDAQTVWVPEVDLATMQNLVGGSIELIPPYDREMQRLQKLRVDLWCCEEGKDLYFAKNFNLYSDNRILDIVYGPVIALASTDDGESVGLSNEQHREARDALLALRRRR